MKMDVLNFFSEFRRMCKSSSDCTKCQYHGDKCDNAIELLEETVAEVEKWSQEHPRKTRQDVFLEQWPESVLVDDIININPCSIVATHRLKIECYKTSCKECRREFWMQEAE